MNNLRITTMVAFVAITTIGCIELPEPRPPSPPRNCSVAEVDGGTEFSCPDDTYAIIPDGADGQDGRDGVDGENGIDGQDGLDGVDGVDGQDGESCTVTDNQDGTVTISCPDGTEATIGESYISTITIHVEGVDSAEISLDGEPIAVAIDELTAATADVDVRDDHVIGCGVVLGFNTQDIDIPADTLEGGSFQSFTCEYTPTSTMDVSGTGLESTVQVGTGEEDDVTTLHIELNALDNTHYLEQLDVRLYANDSLDWSDFGNIAADMVMAHATLYDGQDYVAGPVGIELADVNEAAGFQAGDYYRAQFEDLADLEQSFVPVGTTGHLQVHVRLLSIAQETTYFAADVVPSEDVHVMDENGYAVGITGEALNSPTSENFAFVTIEPAR